jgi:threonine dehydrogenase-like Zn-dependent dehydrogenase/CheY-like chemotaxis protein
VDDNRPFLGSLARHLRQRRCTIVETTSVEAALEIVRDDTIDLDVAILDMVMGADPEGGLKILDEMRRVRPDVSNIILTAFPSDPSKIRSTHRGIIAYLDKATEIEVLLEFIDRGYVDRHGERYRLEDDRGTMWALGMPEGKERLECFTNVPLPRFKDDEVVVKTTHLGVCGTDVEYFTSDKQVDRTYPLIEFHEAVGEVVAVGRDVEEQFGLGDWVVPMVRRCQEWVGRDRGDWNTDVRRCRESYECDNYLHAHACPKGRYLSRGTSKYHGFGAEYFSDAADYLVKVDDEIRDSLGHLCVLTEPLSVSRKAIRLINERRGIRGQDRILIAGLGPIGLFCIALLHHRFPGHEIIAVDIVEENHHKVKMLRDNFNNRIKYCKVERGRPWPKQLTSHKFDVIIDATGDGVDMFPKMSRAIGPEGVLALLGFAGEDGPETDPAVGGAFIDAVVRGGIQIIGSVCASKEDMRDSLCFMANECPRPLLNDIRHPRTAFSPQKAPREISRRRQSGDYIKMTIAP